MSVPTVFLIRHGQAGTRDDYDRPPRRSGEEQAQRLARHFLREGIEFDCWIAGGLRRRSSRRAAIVREIHAEAGLRLPELKIDARWSEFDLDQVYAGIAPQIAARDEAFRGHYEEMMELVRSGDGAIHRRWTAADTLVVRAWIEQQYPFEGESWEGFLGRVHEAFRDAWHGAARRTAVFTSATPAAIAVASSFGSRSPERIMRLAGAALNTNFTVFDVRDGSPGLLCFNAVPHLEEPRLRTFR